MGQFSYGQLKQQRENSDKPRVEFFTLKEDKEEAIVRFVRSSINDFDVFAAHVIQENGRFKAYNCIRERYDPVSKCPLCEAGEKIALKCYFYLIQYTKDAEGNVVATPKVWDRSLGFARTNLEPIYEEYGDLTQQVFKIKRNGLKLDTTYTILPLNAAIYTPELYPHHPEFFDGYTALGTMLKNASFEDLQALVSGGDAFDIADEDIPFDTTAPALADVAIPTPQPSFAATPATPQPSFAATPAPPQRTYSQPGQQAPEMQRPRRFYNTQQ